MSDRVAGNVTPLVVRHPLQPAPAVQVAHQATFTPPAAPAPAGVPHSQLTLDPSSARVVQEYFNAAGTLTNLTPSRSQLLAYRLAALSGDGEGPKPEGQVSGGFEDAD